MGCSHLLKQSVNAIGLLYENTRKEEAALSSSDRTLLKDVGDQTEAP